MSKILGLDLGTNSIGWALIDDEAGEIINIGSRVFEAGLNEIGTAKEQSKNSSRREARQMRRQNRRWRQRRDFLKKVLIEEGMFPEDVKEQQKYLLMDPYRLRSRGISEELSIFEFGRILLHLNQRRGFRSNRLSGDEEEGKIYKGKDETTGITETELNIKSGGYKTLGEYLASLDTDQLRRRNRYTTRNMYVDEFEYLWENQAKFHNKKLHNEIQEKIFRIIFFQRKLKSQKDKIGYCSLETSKRRTPISSPVFQKFRILEQLSRIRITIPNTQRHDSCLSDDERVLVFNELNIKKELTFTRIRKLLKLPESAHINLEDNEKLIGNRTYQALSSLFDKKTWLEFSEDKKEHIWFTMHFSDDPNWLKDYANKKWGFKEENHNKLRKLSLEKGYARFSKKAIQRLIPHLENGLPIVNAIKEAGHKEDKNADSSVVELLGLPPELRNPIVRKGLYELRKLINAILEEHGRPDVIRIEMAREMKKPKKQRMKMRYDQLDMEKEHNKIRQTLKDELGIVHPSMEDIHKYRLWEECGRMCPYTGKKISLKALYGGEFEIEHILPYSRSLNNSLYNKTLCCRSENLIKGNQTPFEAYSGDKQRFDEIMLRVRKTGLKKKQSLFLMKDIPDDFIERQLNDTAYFSRETVKYLQPVSEKIQVVKGGTTALLRHYWGLNTVLGKGEIKNRDDHRHHAVDALVIANTSHKNVKTLSLYHKLGIKRETMKAQGERFAHPWDGFRNDAISAVNNIFVSHHLNKRVRGQLHEDTYYGQIRDNDGEDQFVVRKDLKNLTPKQVGNIVDPVVKETVLERIREYGENTDRKFTIPKEAFVIPLYMPESGDKRKRQIKSVRVIVPSTGLIQLYKDRKTYVEPGSNHHIEIFENNEGKKDGRVVTLFEAVQRIREKRPVVDKEFEQGWEFLMSLSINEMMLMDVEEEEIDWNDPYLAQDYSDRLYRVQKMTRTNNQIFFRLHTAARLKDENNKDIGVMSKYPSTLNGIKVRIDPMGRLRKAYD